MSYEEVSNLTGFATLLYFVAIFAVVLVYALWPANKKRFNEAARIPLHED